MQVKSIRVVIECDDGQKIELETGEHAEHIECSYDRRTDPPSMYLPDAAGRVVKRPERHSLELTATWQGK